MLDQFTQNTISTANQGKQSDAGPQKSSKQRKATQLDLCRPHQAVNLESSNEEFDRTLMKKLTHRRRRYNRENESNRIKNNPTSNTKKTEITKSITTSPRSQSLKNIEEVIRQSPNCKAIGPQRVLKPFT